MSDRQLEHDARRLEELGYEQQLQRRLGTADVIALGFAGISPAVGLFAVVSVGTMVAGAAWVWALPIVLLGQCLLLTVYAQLSSRLPVAGGAYQWSRRLVGDRYGWLTGWVAVWAYVAADTTVSYLAAPWALSLVGAPVNPRTIVLTGVVLIVLWALAGATGIDFMSRVVRVGVVAEIAVAVGIGLALLCFAQQHPVSLFFDSGVGGFRPDQITAGAFLAAVAVAGWVFVGFDVGVGVVEETRSPERRVPLGIWVSLLGVGAIVILDALAIALAHPDPASVIDGRDLDPVTTAVVSAFGDWSAKPLAAVVLTAFAACGIAAQALTARTLFSLARDRALPASDRLGLVNRRRVPAWAIATTATMASLGLLLGLEATAVGSLVAFGTAGIYLAFLMTATAGLIARMNGRWEPRGGRSRVVAGTVVNALAVAWLAFETVNIAWPRESLTPAGAPAYQIWAAPITLCAVLGLGLVYLTLARPDKHSGD